MTVTVYIYRVDERGRRYSIDELANLAKIVIRRLWPGPHLVRVSVAGGVFRSSTLVRQVFRNALQAARPDVAVSFGHVHPVAGALELARKAAREARLTQTT